MSEPSRLVQVFKVIESLKETGVLVDYAIGGAMGVLFYAEPLRTYDLDVLVFLPEEASAIVTGGRKRREHEARLLEFPGFERERLADILRRHGLAERWGKEWAEE